ncbi:MAG: rod shape-determining protein RodA [Thermodesulfobacteriota bacterium]
MMQHPKWTPHTTTSLEWPLILLSGVLTAIGIGLIHSATGPIGYAGRILVLKQLTWLGLSLVVMTAVLLVDYKDLANWAPWVYLAALLALVAVWGFGKMTAGSRRWVELGLFTVQPSEFAKLAVVIVVARYFQYRSTLREPRPADLLPPILLTAVPALMVRFQPDLGTAGVIALTGLSMIVFAGVGRRELLWLGGAVIALLPVLFLLGNRLLLEYQLDRLKTFLNPDHDRLGAGYHIIQSQIAIGSGGLLGKGYGQGTQNTLMFLPVKHTDFIFSILAEEWGFLGCVVVLGLFAVLVMRGLAIAARARDDFGVLLTFGCVALLFWHAVINVGMVMGLVPVVGVPLSFVSYGGSSLLVSFMAVGLMANVSMRRSHYE